MAAFDSEIFGMYINCCYFCVHVRPKNFLSLSSFFFIVPRYDDDQVGLLRQSTIAETLDEKMRVSEMECGREAFEDEIEVCTFPVTQVLW